MDSEKRLRHELAELNLLLKGLAQIPHFPAELLELIASKIANISLLIFKSEETLSDEKPIDSFEIFHEEMSTTIESVTEVSDHSFSVTRINDQMVQLRMTDLSKSLTLNDRFCFQREFFENDPEKMNEVFSAINKTKSVEEALIYFRGVCSVDEGSDIFKNFLLMLDIHFANGLIGRKSI
jgi:hypothetical protein